MDEPARADTTRWSLIHRAAAGDGAARSAFARTYLPVVRSFLAARWRATAMADAVDDAVQEVFLECLREGGVLLRADGARGDLRGLLWGVASNVARRLEERALARRRQAAGDEPLLDAVPDRGPSLSVLFDREWARSLVRLAGERMRAEAQGGDPGARLRVELLRLRFSAGLPVREIAARWEMDPDAVHRAYGKAREEFRACLRRVVAEEAVRSEVELDQEVARILTALD